MARLCMLWLLYYGIQQRYMSTPFSHSYVTMKATVELMAS